MRKIIVFVLAVFILCNTTLYARQSTRIGYYAERAPSRKKTTKSFVKEINILF